MNNQEDEDVELYSDDEELGSVEDDEDDDFDEDYDSDEMLDNLSETELEEMAASTARQLQMVQMQVAMATKQAETRQVQMAQMQAAIASGRQQDARQLMMSQMQAAIASDQDNDLMDVDERSSHEKWQDFLDAMQRSKVLKIMDTDWADMKMEQPQQQSRALDDLMAAIRSHEGLTHIILEGTFLACFQSKQRFLFEAFWGKHYATLTYLKLGSDELGAGVLDLDSLLAVLKMAPSANDGGNGEIFALNLTEMELCKLSIESPTLVAAFPPLLSRAKSLKQLNLLGIHVEMSTPGLLDPILQTVANLRMLDECLLSCSKASSVPLVSAACLEKVLRQKPKWWRLGLDGVGLEDEHCRIMATAMSSSEVCKAGDLLSLTMNPAVTARGWTRVFDVLFQKQRMGLVKVDDCTWQANFNLVRSMNNLHGRLAYFDRNGSYPSRERWLDWLVKLSQITWEDEAHKVNYLWFSILERPDFVNWG